MKTLSRSRRDRARALFVAAGLLAAIGCGSVAQKGTGAGGAGGGAGGTSGQADGGGSGGASGSGPCTLGTSKVGNCLVQ